MLTSLAGCMLLCSLLRMPSLVAAEKRCKAMSWGFHMDTHTLQLIGPQQKCTTSPPPIPLSASVTAALLVQLPLLPVLLVLAPKLHALEYFFSTTTSTPNDVCHLSTHIQFLTTINTR